MYPCACWAIAFMLEQVNAPELTFTRRLGLQHKPPFATSFFSHVSRDKYHKELRPRVGESSPLIRSHTAQSFIKDGFRGIMEKFATVIFTCSHGSLNTFSTSS